MGFEVDQDKCISCGACWSSYPDIFEEDTASGKCKVKSNPAKPSKYNKSGNEIALICPVEAISYK